MPVNFLTEDQKAGYGNYHGELTKETLARYFHLDDFDRMNISEKRGDHNRLGYAILLCTVRYLGRFPDVTTIIPIAVIDFLAEQLHIESGGEQVNIYNSGKQRRQHIAEITKIYGYTEFTDTRVAFSLTRWLYSLCWTGTSRPGILFERCTGWLLSHKVLLPGYSLLERYIARLRSKVENRLWYSLAACIDDSQAQRLLELLSVPAGSRYSLLDQLRTGPTKVNATSLVQATGRLQTIRNLGVTLPAITPVSDTRIAALARYASTAKTTALQRLPEKRKLATLVAFSCCMEATAQDDALELLEALLRDLFNEAVQADKRNRQRTLKDLDRAAEILAKACRMILDDKLPDIDVRDNIFNIIPEDVLKHAVNNVTSLVRPANNVYFNELDAKFKTVRRFLPDLLSRIHFEGNASAETLIEALCWVEVNLKKKKTDNDAPREIINKPWQQHVIRKDGRKLGAPGGLSRRMLEIELPFLPTLSPDELFRIRTDYEPSATAFRRTLRDCALEMERAANPNEIRMLQTRFQERIADEGLEDLQEKLRGWKRRSLQDVALLSAPAVLGYIGAPAVTSLAAGAVSILQATIGAWRNYQDVTRHPSWFLLRTKGTRCFRK